MSYTKVIKIGNKALYSPEATQKNTLRYFLPSEISDFPAALNSWIKTYL